MLFFISNYIIHYWEDFFLICIHQQKNGFLLKDIYFIDKQKFHFQEKVQALTLSDFIYLFEEAGLKIINLWGDYSLVDYNVIHSPRLIILAQK